MTKGVEQSEFRVDGRPVMGATFSEDRVYRYALWRSWGDTSKQFCVIGLNPSTADETKDDPTIRRCIAFAKREGCGALMMLNLFAYRSMNPLALYSLSTRDAVGPLNDEQIAFHVRFATTIVAAWGAQRIAIERGHYIAGQIRRLYEREVHCLGVTRNFSPRHPLYVKGDEPLRLYAV